MKLKKKKKKTESQGDLFQRNMGGPIFSKTGQVETMSDIKFSIIYQFFIETVKWLVGCANYLKNM